MHGTDGGSTCACAQVFHASPKLAAVGSVDEAIVIGAALSLSSSAFVLQLLSERGELATRFGSATLGILLLQVRLGLCMCQQGRHVQCFWLALHAGATWRGLSHGILLLPA